MCISYFEGFRSPLWTGLYEPVGWLGLKPDSLSAACAHLNSERDQVASIEHATQLCSSYS